MSSFAAGFLRRGRVLLTACGLIAASVITAARPAAAVAYAPISGAGSTWAQNAIDHWRRDVQPYGMRINYAGTGSTDGRRQFLNNTVDFAVSDVPFQTQPEDGSPPENPGGLSFAYMPVAAGGTTFMYNLTNHGQRITGLRLSGENLVKIFTGVITNWDDRALAADNPQIPLPHRTIVPVVHAEASGSTWQLTTWMISQHPALWTAYCQRTGRAPACNHTQYYPTIPGIVAQAGDFGVAGYIVQGYADGAIGYVPYSTALGAGFAVAKMLNAAGYYAEPTPDKRGPIVIEGPG